MDLSQLDKRLIEAFDVFDNAKNRQVDVRELGTIIRSLGGYYILYSFIKHFKQTYNCLRLHYN
jgi:Ca2+-binding EF-hand superfamily protein